MTISRKKMSRGNKLTTQHVLVLKNASGQLYGNVSTEEMESKLGTFSISYHMAVLPGLTTEGYRFLAAENRTDDETGLDFEYGPENSHQGEDLKDGQECLRSFTLPPFQEDWDFTTMGKLNKNIVHYLDEIYISFDQRDEGVVLRNHEHNVITGESCTTDYATPYAADAYDLKIGLYHKRMDVTTNTGTQGSAKDYLGQVIEFDVSGESFIDATYKLNPFLLTGINKEVSPFNTYVLSIRAPNIGNYINQYSHDIGDPGDGEIDPETEIVKNQAAYVFLSFNVVLKFKTALVRRDRNFGAPDFIQNIPTIHNGQYDPEAVVIFDPTANQLITADASNTGVQSNIARLDKAFLDKMYGGYDEHGDRWIGEQLENDACYEVVTIPLFNIGTSINTGNLAETPFLYADGAFTNGVIGCRAVIPIRYPMVLHHVIALENHCFEAGITTSPFMIDPAAPYLGNNCVTKVDVGLVSGINANNPQYQPLAHGEWNATTRISDAIDTIYGPTNPFSASTGMSKKQYLHVVPLVGTVGNLGDGWRLAQGRPIYVGKSNMNTVARTDIADNLPGSGGAYGASNTAGEETAIEIRWQITDARANAWNGHIEEDVVNGIVGVGGHVVYLIFKKHLLSCAE